MTCDKTRFGILSWLELIMKAREKKEGLRRGIKMSWSSISRTKTPEFVAEFIEIWHGEKFVF